MIASQHLIEYNRTAKLIATGIDDTGCLFWSHVADSAAYCDGLTYARSRLQRAGNTKIGNDQTMVFLVDQNIFRLDIAMDNGAWARVGIIQRLRELVKMMNRFLRWQGPVDLG